MLVATSCLVATAGGGGYASAFPRHLALEDDITVFCNLIEAKKQPWFRIHPMFQHRCPNGPLKAENGLNFTAAGIFDLRLGDLEMRG